MPPARPSSKAARRVRSGRCGQRPTSGSAGGIPATPATPASNSERQRRPEQYQPAEDLADEDEEDRDVEEARGRHRLGDLEGPVDHPAETEGGERAEHEARREEDAVVTDEGGDRAAPARDERERRD